MSRQHPEPNPLLSFAADLAAQSEPGIRERLEAWVGRVATAQGVLVPKPPTAVSGPEFLMFVAEPYDQKSEKFKADAWHFHGAEHGDNLDGAMRRRDELAELVNNHLGTSVKELWAELFLPVELLVEGLSGWNVNVAPGDSMSIDECYPVRLRSWDRIFMRGRYFRPAVFRDWLARWAKRPITGAQPTDRDLVEVYEPDHYISDGMVRRHRDGGAICLIASLAPSAASGGIEKARNLLTSLLVAGTPIAVWPEELDR